MGFMRLIQFYQEAGTYVSPDKTAVEKASEAGERHAAFHNRIVLVSGLFGGLGAALGLVLSVLVAGDVKSGTDVKMMLLAPFLFGAAGLLFGVAVACLFAPGEFLKGPLGQKWMQLIGTNRVIVARLVCLIFGLVVVTPFVGLGLLIALGK